MKRFFDLILSLLLIFITLPVQILIALIIFIQFRANPFFVQERGVTLNNFRFKIYKFRTLAKSKDSKYHHRKKEDIFYNTSFAENLSFFASWLRRTTLDELPQLYNILLGHMSFVGPRPFMTEDLKIMKKVYPDYYLQRSKFKSRPGFTGIWQIYGDRSGGIENLIALETIYENVKSFWIDIKLIFATAPIVFAAKNSDSIAVQNSSEHRILPQSLIKDLNVKFDVSIRAAAKDFTSHKEGYTIEIPANWWYASDTYDSKDNSEKHAKVFSINGTEGIKRKKGA